MPKGLHLAEPSTDEHGFLFTTARLGKTLLRNAEPTLGSWNSALFYWQTHFSKSVSSHSIRKQTHSSLCSKANTAASNISSALHILSGFKCCTSSSHYFYSAVGNMSTYPDPKELFSLFLVQFSLQRKEKNCKTKIYPQPHQIARELWLLQWDESLCKGYCD